MIRSRHFRRPRPEVLERLIWGSRPVLLTALLVMALVSSPAASQKKPKHAKHKADSALTALAAEGSGDIPVIVRMKPGREEAVGTRMKAAGKRVKGEHALISALSADMDPDEIAALEDDDDVESVSYDAPVVSSADSLRVVAGLKATLGTKTPMPDGSGKGVGVAVVDSGIFNMSDFDDRVPGVYDFANGKSGSRLDSLDAYGHGTHVAGLIGGVSRQANGQLYQGLAPGVRLIGFRVLDDQGRGQTSDVLRALEYIVKNRVSLKIDVINLSLGHPIYEPAATDPLVEAVETAVRAGIVVVVSAGNFGVNPETKVAGYAGITSPGNAPSAITVGAFNSSGTAERTDDRMAPYSSRGPTWYDGYVKPDLVAPGHALVSNQDKDSKLLAAYPNNAVAICRGVKFIRLSGTSMAAAVTTGAAALVIEASRLANPNGPAITPNAVKAILQYTATVLRDDAGMPYDVLTQGAGALNPAGAVELASSIKTSVPVGSPWLTSSLVTYTSFGSRAEPWAQNIVWGDNIVWGNSVNNNQMAWSLNVVWGNNIVWGNSIVWGNNIVWGNSIVWGNNIVWADNIVWGNNIVWGSNIVWGNNVVWGDSLDSDR